MANELRIVVAGAAGFIGSHLCDRLIAEGHEVIAVDNLLTGSLANLEQLAAEPRFHYIQHDIVSPVKLEGAIDVVVNMASPASPKDYLAHPIETLDVGSIGSRNMLELALRHDARYLLTSTSECYGDPHEHPQRESYWGNVNPVGPRSCYDESKRFAEALTMAFHRKHGLRTAIARIFNTYGPRMKLDDGRVVPALVGQALQGGDMTIFGDGSQTRSFCYVSDMVDGLFRMMFCEDPYPINVGNPHEMTILQFADAIRQLTGTKSRLVFHPLPEDDPRQRQPDITRARAVLGWEPKVGLEEGLQLTCRYFATRAGKASTTWSPGQPHH
jgi:dTDP-glucose 4,6-dehydratase